MILKYEFCKNMHQNCRELFPSNELETLISLKEETTYEMVLTTNPNLR